MSVPTGGQSTCTYNPTSDDATPDEAQACTHPGVWHIRIADSGPDLDGMYITCDFHTAIAFQLEGKRQFHEFGPGCGLEGGYWHTEHNVCTSLDTALANGIFWYECAVALPAPEGLALGVYARFREGWYRIAGPYNGRGGQIWLGSGPPPGFDPNGEFVTFQPEG